MKRQHFAKRAEAELPYPDCPAPYREKDIRISALRKSTALFFLSLAFPLLLSACAADGHTGISGTNSDAGSFPLSAAEEREAATKSHGQQEEEEMNKQATPQNSPTTSPQASPEVTTSSAIPSALEPAGSLEPAGALEPAASSEAAGLPETASHSIRVGETLFSLTLYDNPAAQAFSARLPLTLTLSELNGNEKFIYLPEGLPADSESPGTVYEGDLMLYGADCLVLFYETFSTSYSYTSLGALDDPAGLADAVGSGEVTVTIT